MQLRGIAKVESINLLLGLLGFSLCRGKSEVPEQGKGFFHAGLVRESCKVIGFYCLRPGGWEQSPFLSSPDLGTS